MEVQVGQNVAFWLGDCSYNPRDPAPDGFVVNDRQHPFVAQVLAVDQYGRVRISFTDHNGTVGEVAEIPVTTASEGDQHANDPWPNGYVTVAA